MHILLIHQAFASLHEPGGTRHHELARYLAEKGHQFTVITSPVSYLTGTARQNSTGWMNRQEEDGVTIVRTYTYAALHRSFVHRMFSFISFMLSSFWAGLSVKQVDIVWGTSPPIFQGLTAWSLARVKGARFLFEVRDLWPDFAIEIGVLKNRLLIQASKWLEAFLYRRADRLLVNSPGFIQHVKERGAANVELVPNGSDPRLFDPSIDGTRFRQEHGLEGKTVFLYAGAHGLANDLFTLLEAAKQLSDHPEITLVLLGDGKEKSALMAKASQEELHNVLFLPPLSKLEMPEALAAADGCLAILKPIPLFRTVYPNKVFDYMAAGKPIILAIQGVIQEVIEETQSGICVSPGDAPAIANAILKLASHPVQSHEMGLRGRRYIETHFDRAVLADQLERILSGMNQRGCIFSDG
jgi:glycosyltransferase involved in cell wall biosynthesis